MIVTSTGATVQAAQEDARARNVAPRATLAGR